MVDETMFEKLEANIQWTQVKNKEKENFFILHVVEFWWFFFLEIDVLKVLIKL